MNVWMVLSGLGLVGCLGFCVWGLRLRRLWQEAVLSVEEWMQRTQELRSRNELLSQSIEAERSFFKEKEKLMEVTRQELATAFQSISFDVLQKNSHSFLSLAKETFEKYQNSARHDLSQRQEAIQHLVKPIQESLKGMGDKLADFDKMRQAGFDVMKHHLQDVVQSQKDLRKETAQLVKALRVPHVRGRWGEMQLRRLIEMSGLSQHCDFLEQLTFDSEGKKHRPDLVVKLPGKKIIMIDAKTPLTAYLDAIEASDEQVRLDHLKDHARIVRQHILALSRRDYWSHVTQYEAPEFVVLFIPGETFFSAALEQDPSLIELGISNKVILASPATLIALLHAIAYGWRQEKLSENAQIISDLGKELYKRLSDMGQHLGKLGRDINSVVQTYNQTIGSIERRVLPTARRFKTLSVSTAEGDILDAAQLTEQTRLIQSPELSRAEDLMEGDSQSNQILLKSA